MHRGRARSLPLLGIVLALAALPAAPVRAVEPLVEWTLHRSADGAHPNGDEQAFVWLMNRARQDPAAEGLFLATLADWRIQSTYRLFGVDLALMQAELAALPPVPPAAFDRRLYEAALAHALDLVARDAQDHSGQSARVLERGFHPVQLRGTAYAYASSPLHGHAAFTVDWGGSDASGMQAGRPHRRAVMSIGGDLPLVGLAVVPEQDYRTQVGPLVVVGNYARPDSAWPDHQDRFAVGTVWSDLDGDGVYDPGEGLGGVEVWAEPGPYFAVTADGGGYALPLLAEGPTEIVFAVPGMALHRVVVQVGADSVLVDRVVPVPGDAALLGSGGTANPVPEPGAMGLGGCALAALLGLTGGRALRRSARAGIGPIASA